MPISRRIFIRTASVAAIAAATVGKSALIAFAQGTMQPGARATDPLAYYTQATFTQYINSIFRLHGFRTVDVMLEKVQDTLPATVSRTGGRESFVLHFRGGDVQFPQDTYTVEHPALGNFRLFLVPSGADENGAQSYVATINRLAYTAKPSAAPRAMPRKSVPTSTPKTESSAPAKVTPEMKTPGPAETPKPQIQVKPRRRKIDPELFPEFDY
ncbi:MAG TPA: hypothetical protein VGW32_01195 [Pyrinomonadaceae bacterium]|nr:hypothetical protein [Pyrinomonadaceae bacterium]